LPLSSRPPAEDSSVFRIEVEGVQSCPRWSAFADHDIVIFEELLEQFQQKWEPVLRPELRLNKEIEHFR
jgi:hypothetical protein